MGARSLAHGSDRGQRDRVVRSGDPSARRARHGVLCRADVDRARRGQLARRGARSALGGTPRLPPGVEHLESRTARAAARRGRRHRPRARGLSGRCAARAHLDQGSRARRLLPGRVRAGHHRRHGHAHLRARAADGLCGATLSALPVAAVARSWRAERRARPISGVPDRRGGRALQRYAARCSAEVAAASGESCAAVGARTLAWECAPCSRCGVNVYAWPRAAPSSSCASTTNAVRAVSSRHFPSSKSMRTRVSGCPASRTEQDSRLMFGSLRHAPAFGVACVALGLIGCSGEIEPGDTPNVDAAGAPGVPGGGRANTASGGAPARGGSSSPSAGAGTGGTLGVGGSATPSGGTGTGAAPADPDALIPARIRRLANAEYDASARALLGSGLNPSIDYDFPPDARQAGFTVNDAQRVDPVVARQYANAAEALAAAAKADVQKFAPCSDPNPGEACAKRFIESFGAKVYRRPLTPAEIDGPAENDGLLDLYRVGAEGATYADGIEQVVRGMVSSAGFLYLTEIGEGTPSPGSKVTLTPYELAASLSYIATAGPPSEALVASALAGDLDTPAGRKQAMSALI